MASGNGQPRVYTISTETANGSLNTDLLGQQIKDNTIITTGLDYFLTAGNELDAYFVSTLSAGEITELDSVVAVHDGYTTFQRWQRWASQKSQSTSSEEWTNAIQRTSEPLLDGYYKVSWNAEVRVVKVGGQLTSKGSVRFSVDDETGPPPPTYVGISNTMVDDWVSFSGWDIHEFHLGATPILQIEFRRDPTIGGDDSIEIRRARMALEYVDFLA
jgi:hypothetical protein